MGTVKIKDLLNILKQDNIRVYKAKLPYEIGGICKPEYINEKDIMYSLIINPKSKSKPKTSLLHELIHIYFNDCQNVQTVNFCEYRTRYFTKKLCKQLNNEMNKVLNNTINNSKVIYE